MLQCVMVNGLDGASVEKNTNLGKKIVSVKIFRLKYLQFCYGKDGIESILYLAEIALFARFLNSCEKSIFLLKVSV